MSRLVLLLMSFTSLLAGCLMWPDDFIPKSARPYGAPAVVKHSTPDSITVTTGKFNYRRASELIQNHCEGPYSEERTESDGRYLIEATCER